VSRTLIRISMLAVVVLGLSAPASAQVVQSVQFGIGGVFPRGRDARSTSDILRRNLRGEALPADPTLSDALFFEIGDFRSAQVFGEWNVSFGPHVEVGAGIGVYGRSVPSFYLDLEDPFGFDIEQTLRLRVVPITGLVRFLPFGRPGDVQPYVGAGVTAMRFRYSEIGDFVDPFTLDIFDDEYVATGTALGGVLLGGLRIPLGGDIYGMALEGRYHFGEGDLPEGRFVSDKIDLSGGQFNVTFLVRF
jgi:hypothetical protein